MYVLCKKARFFFLFIYDYKREKMLSREKILVAIIICSVYVKFHFIIFSHFLTSSNTENHVLCSSLSQVVWWSLNNDIWWYMLAHLAFFTSLQRSFFIVAFLHFLREWKRSIFRSSNLWCSSIIAFWGAVLLLLSTKKIMGNNSTRILDLGKTQ